MKIIPLHTGTLKRDKATFVMGAPAERINVPIIMFLVQTRDMNILVDSGTRDPKETPLVHGQYEQTEDLRPLNHLLRLGLRPDDIDIVINTHLHWDHCSNNALFTKAKFYVQREELRYASAPLPVHTHGYEAFETGLIPPFVGTKFEILDGDQKIIDGVSVLFTPGHTPGLQSVLLTSEEGSCVIASDNIPFYENLKGKTITDFTPSTIYVDLESYYRSIRRVIELGFTIIPGHEISLVGKVDVLS
jgi:glyoxylase-like metal-dependent hydrolase (beta-lactamase superfamily II)